MGMACLVPGDQQGSIVGPRGEHPEYVGDRRAGVNDRSRAGPLCQRDDHEQRCRHQGTNGMEPTGRGYAALRSPVKGQDCPDCRVQI
ncbi:hypothetical protein NDU88_004167 [Pleurodeles waltl]|uniref:Uncharacterized protein n=1 Tax=Pleurodeles waltl TaxID=8319 RepID=A0AAV7W6M0_PLEWA|nr:hypothetical protein NDU88_004167 [Pleurodeles waltl]